MIAYINSKIPITIIDTAAKSSSISCLIHQGATAAPASPSNTNNTAIITPMTAAIAAHFSAVMSHSPCSHNAAP